MRMSHTHCTYIQMFAFSLNTLFSYFLSVNNIHSCYFVFLFYFACIVLKLTCYRKLETLADRKMLISSQRWSLFLVLVTCGIFI